VISELFRGHVGAFEVLDQCLHARRNETADDRLEQLFLGLEIKVQQALADAGAARHVIHTCRRITVLGEYLHGGRRNFRRPFLLAALVARLCHCSARY
jgi:hypothetical protein